MSENFQPQQDQPKPKKKPVSIDISRDTPTKTINAVSKKPVWRLPDSVIKAQETILQKSNTSKPKVEKKTGMEEYVVETIQDMQRMLWMQSGKGKPHEGYSAFIRGSQLSHGKIIGKDATGEYAIGYSAKDGKNIIYKEGIRNGVYTYHGICSYNNEIYETSITGSKSQTNKISSNEGYTNALSAIRFTALLGGISKLVPEKDTELALATTKSIDPTQLYRPKAN